MPTILQLRRGTAAQNAAYTGSVGELTVDTENTIFTTTRWFDSRWFRGW